MNDNSNVIASIIAGALFLVIIGFIANAGSTPAAKCMEPGCDRECATGSNYCYIHKKYTGGSSKTYSSTPKSSTPSTTAKPSSATKTTKKTYDPYNVQDYSSAQDFADDKYEEFYDYEDDYEDEDEAYDAAEDYWREHHK